MTLDTLFETEDQAKRLKEVEKENSRLRKLVAYRGGVQMERRTNP